MSSERASERLVSGGGVAKKPKEVGEESRVEAAERLAVRVRWRAAGGGRGSGGWFRERRGRGWRWGCCWWP